MLGLMRVCVWNSLRVWILYRSFDRNEISFLGMKYHVNTTRNEMPTRVHQNIGSFWNAAEIKLHLNRTCFKISNRYELILPHNVGYWNLLLVLAVQYWLLIKKIFVLVSLLITLNSIVGYLYLIYKKFYLILN